MRAFPSDLAREVCERWETMCRRAFAGVRLLPQNFVPAVCPPQRILRELLEVAQLAAGVPEEGRYPRFNLAATPARDENDKGWSSRIENLFGDNAQDVIGVSAKFESFEQPRSFTVGELRRIAPAIDPDTSAIWTQWSKNKCQVAGLLDFGPDWRRARLGMEYQYSAPACLMIEVERPGRVRVYLSGLHVASLTDGQIEGWGRRYVASLFGLVKSSLKHISAEFIHPRSINQETELYEQIALWNIYAGIANSISARAHGGSIIIIPSETNFSSAALRIKYPVKSERLRSAFIGHINARRELLHELRLTGRKQARRKTERRSDSRALDRILVKQCILERERIKMADAIQWVAQLSGCDGAILLSDDLSLAGFGVEIRAELKESAKVREMIDDRLSKARPLDAEQFGMRHRSAVKLVSQNPSYTVLVISQDGPVSAVWSDDEDEVCVSKNIDLMGLHVSA